MGGGGDNTGNKVNCMADSKTVSAMKKNKARKGEGVCWGLEEGSNFK
jgi:hypothetical protein